MPLTPTDIATSFAQRRDRRHACEPAPPLAPYPRIAACAARA
jgi:hypothetical protein